MFGLAKKRFYCINITDEKGTSIKMEYGLHTNSIEANIAANKMLLGTKGGFRAKCEEVDAQTLINTTNELVRLFVVVEKGMESAKAVRPPVRMTA